MIPKKLHFIWVGDDSKRPDNCIETWRKLNPSWEIIVWGNESLSERPWINGRHMIEMSDHEYNGVADMMRWEIVYEQGGFVVDADSICIRPLDDSLRDCEAFTCWESEIARPGLLAAGYFASCPNNAFVGQIILDIHNEETVVDKMAWETVGPQRLTDSFRKYQYHGLRILPSHYFIPDHFSGVSYDGRDAVYAYQLWGSTMETYDRIHLQELDSNNSADASRELVLGSDPALAAAA
jgi:mannosyltransferase OCH1-like enzyme